MFIFDGRNSANSRINSDSISDNVAAVSLLIGNCKRVSITIGFQLWQNLRRHWEGTGGERKGLKHKKKAKEVSMSGQNDHFSKVVNLRNWLCVHAGAGLFYTFMILDSIFSPF
jgi:hypothetical protein